MTLRRRTSPPETIGVRSTWAGPALRRLRKVAVPAALLAGLGAADGANAQLIPDGPYAGQPNAPATPPAGGGFFGLVPDGAPAPQAPAATTPQQA
ncbi:MAG: hypothetical protein AAF907_00955, partial [Planctomycetota bacterium]